MGVDFTAILDHGLSWQALNQLPATLTSRWATPSSLAVFLTRYPNAGTHWRWRLSGTFSNAEEELFDEGHVRLEGPAGFVASVFKHALEVTSCARWWSFLFEPDVRAGLLEGVRNLAGILRSSTIVYLPDSAFPPSVASDRLYEGSTVAEVVSWLETNVGKQAQSIDALRGPDGDRVDESGYLIERFERPTATGRMTPKIERCPCCGCRTLSERGGFEMCGVCWWEDDGQGDAEADEVRGGPNGNLSLTQARVNYRRFGASDSRFVDRVRKPTREEAE